MNKNYFLLTIAAVLAILVGVHVHPEFFDIYNVICLGCIFFVAPLFITSLPDTGKSKNSLEGIPLLSLVAALTAVICGADVWLLPLVFVLIMMVFEVIIFLFIPKHDVSAFGKAVYWQALLSDAFYLLFLAYLIWVAILVMLKGWILLAA